MKNIKKTIVFFPVILSLFVALSISEKVHTQTKSYVEELEEAFVAKINNDNTTKRTDSSISENIIKKAKKESGVTLPGDENAIGKEVVNYLKASIKSPLLDFLSSSELTDWSTVKARYENSKQALEIFGAKYKTELEAGKQTTIAAQPTTPTMPTQTLPTTIVPGLKSAAPIAAIPTAIAPTTSLPTAMAPTTMPITAAPTMGAQPALVAGADEEIVEVEVDEFGNEIVTPAPTGMPMPSAPTSMPGINAPSSMPIAAPTTIAPKTTTPVMGARPSMPITAPAALSPMTARPTMPVAVAPKAAAPTAPKVQYSIPAPKPATPMGGMTAAPAFGGMPMAK